MRKWKKVSDGRQIEKRVRPVLTRGQWRETLNREREVKMLSAQGPLMSEVFELGAFFHRSLIVPPCVFLCASVSRVEGAAFRVRLFFLPLSDVPCNCLLRLP